MDDGCRREIRALAKLSGATWAMGDMMLQGLEDEISDLLHLEVKVADIGFDNVLLGIKFDRVQVFIEVGCLQRTEVRILADFVEVMYKRNICIEDFIRDLEDYIQTMFRDPIANVPKIKFFKALEY